MAWPLASRTQAKKTSSRLVPVQLICLPYLSTDRPEIQFARQSNGQSYLDSGARGHWEDLHSAR
eukprot:9450311-Alexandrium_andersonii.AAC.1